MNQVTIENAPKTLKESLERAVVFLKLKPKGDSLYQNFDGNPCLIGSYFTPEQLKWIRMKNMNKEPITSLYCEVGEKNLTAMTSMTLDQCTVLQQLYDSGNGPLLQSAISTVLKGKKKTIEGISFRI